MRGYHSTFLFCSKTKQNKIGKSKINLNIYYTLASLVFIKDTYHGQKNQLSKGKV